jgi:hypothetical protein
LSLFSIFFFFHLSNNVEFFFKKFLLSVLNLFLNFSKILEKKKKEIEIVRKEAF